MQTLCKRAFVIACRGGAVSLRRSGSTSASDKVPVSPHEVHSLLPAEVALTNAATGGVLTTRVSDRLSRPTLISSAGCGSGGCVRVTPAAVLRGVGVYKDN